MLIILRASKYNKTTITESQKHSNLTNLQLGPLKFGDR